MRTLRSLALVGLLLAPILLAPAAVLAQDHGAAVVEAGDLRISDLEVAATMAGAPTAAAYMTIANAGAAPDRLLAVESAAARRVELHTTEVENGVARMTPLAEGVAIPAGETATLARRGLHVMLMGLTAPLAEGAPVDLTLVFETAGRVEVEAPVHLGAAMHHGQPGG